MARRMKWFFWLFVLPCLGPVVNAAVVEAHIDRTAATRAVARPFLQRLFGDRDVQGAYGQFAAPDFVQHDPQMADGLAGQAAFLERLAGQEGGHPDDWVDVIDIILVDGGHVAVMHHVFRNVLDPGRLMVDIWRVDAGRIVEHWNVVQSMPEHMAHANGMACGNGQDFPSARNRGGRWQDPACGWPDRQARRTETLAVVDAYAETLLAGDVRGAITRWFAPGYRQHSPFIADGIQGAIAHLEAQFGKGSAARPTFGPARIIAEGDYLLLHRLATQPGGVATANIDIFRVTNGRISEHWDLKQAVPDAAANDNGMW